MNPSEFVPDDQAQHAYSSRTGAPAYCPRRRITYRRPSPIPISFRPFPRHTKGDKLGEPAPPRLPRCTRRRLPRPLTGPIPSAQPNVTARWIIRRAAGQVPPYCSRQTQDTPRSRSAQPSPEGPRGFARVNSRLGRYASAHTHTEGAFRACSRKEYPRLHQHRSAGIALNQARRPTLHTEPPATKLDHNTISRRWLCQGKSLTK